MGGSDGRVFWKKWVPSRRTNPAPETFENARLKHGPETRGISRDEGGL